MRNAGRRFAAFGWLDGQCHRADRSEAGLSRIISARLFAEISTPYRRVEETFVYLRPTALIPNYTAAPQSAGKAFLPEQGTNAASSFEGIGDIRVDFTTHVADGESRSITLPIFAAGNKTTAAI